jgi:hypothetical protein
LLGQVEADEVNLHLRFAFHQREELEGPPLLPSFLQKGCGLTIHVINNTTNLALFLFT